MGDFIYEKIPQFTAETVKKKRPRLMAVVNDNCTGCEACVEFCPVLCIDHPPPAQYTGVVIPPIRIRWHECIGCQICARVCEGLAWNAIDMVPIDEFEREHGVKVGDATHPPEEAEEISEAAAPRG